MRNRSILLAAMLLSATASAHMACADDAPLVEDLGADLLKPATTVAPWGEEITQRKIGNDDWRKKVVSHMQDAESHLKRFREASGAGAAQSKALTGLDAMIAELTQRQSQCRGGQCKQPGSPKPGKKPGKAGKSGTSPATSASAAQSTDQPITVTAAAADLVRDLWGHLPERQREKILQPLSEEFLPKYAPEIEAYFRALADPDSRRPAQP